MSKFQSLLYFLSRNREVALVSATAASVTLMGIGFLPHTIGITKYKEFLQAYKEGKEREITPKTDYLFVKALELCDLPAYKKKLIKPFVVCGFDATSIGSTNFRQGVFLGIPINYSYETTDDIDRSEIISRGEKIDWKSKQGKLLEEALVLNEDEKIFGIARSILEADTHKVSLTSVYPFVAIFLVYTATKNLNIRLNLYGRPLGLRMMLYSIVYLFGFGIWGFMQDFTTVNLEASIDKRLSELGPEFVEAGVRFYNKLLQKNVAIRDLIKDNTYTAKGNVNYMLRQKSLPLTIRKQFFEEKLKGGDGEIDVKV